MAQFRKKPVVIDAIQWDGTNVGELRDFFGSFLDWRFVNCHSVDIKTLEGNMRACPTDWIIKGVRGEFYPCNDEVFALTYDPV